MALTLLEVKNKLQPYILRFIDKESAEWIFDSEFIDMVNLVAHQLNEAAHVNTERYYRKTVSGTNYYEMAGDIVDMYLFKYYDSIYQSQYYAIVPVAGTPFVSMIVLKTTPTSELQMDIHYFRRCLEVSVDADEIDLKDVALPEFIELLKTKIQVDFGKADPLIHERNLQIMARKVQSKLDPIPLYGGRVKRYFGKLDSTCDHLYDITANRLATDHVIVGGGGTYTWYE